MKIYKTETYKVIDHKDYLDVPTKYYLDYLAAVASIPEHGGELTKYEDCHSDTFCHREVWVE